MYSFVVLGQIPGTSITISFTMWIQLALLLTMAVLLYKYTHKTKHTQNQKLSSFMIIRNGKPVRADEISL